VIVVDANATSHAFPHFWEKMFGSGRAVLSLRDSYRRDLREVKQVTDFEYVRFHAILHDEVGIYDEDGQGSPLFNFSYVDQIYDGLLANGVKPFVELRIPCTVSGINRISLRQRIGRSGMTSLPYSRNIWLIAMVSMKSRSGTSKFGMNLIWISGEGNPGRRLTGSSMTTPRAQ
jgi:hypothetical protein